MEQNDNNKKKKLKRSHKVLIGVGSFILLIAICWTTLALLPRQDNFKGDNPMLKDENSPTPILIAHGGGNKEFPDNTLEAFYNAYSVDENFMLETDVSITKDDVVILSHDITLDRKTNVTGFISDWNYSDLISQKVDFSYTNPVKYDEETGIPTLNGERVKFKTDSGIEVTPLDVEYPSNVVARDDNVFLATTLEDLLISFPNNRVNVEIKQSGDLGLKCFNKVLSLVEEYNAWDRVVLASFHNEIYDEFVDYHNEVNDKLMYSPSTGPVIKYYLLQLLGLDYFFNDSIAVFQIPTSQSIFDLSTKKIINNMHEHNIAVHYWTINDKDEMRELVEMGADGIMSDYPHRLEEVYNEYR